MTESGAVFDFNNLIRPTTANENAAIRRIRLCHDNFKSNIKLIENEYSVKNNQLIKDKFELEFELARISKIKF